MVSLPPPGMVAALIAIDGGGAIVNGSAADVPPPGVGEKTLTCAIPTDATSAAPIAACSCVALTNVVGRLVPFQRTTDEATKPAPLTVSMNAALPTDIEPGERPLTFGSGLGP